MRIDIISVVPELLSGPFNSSIIKKAIDKKIIEIHIHNLRDYSTNNYRSIDDYQYGGGAGMVMLIEPIDNCIAELKKERDYDQIIYMTPDGDTLNQGISNKLSCMKNIIILPMKGIAIILGVLALVLPVFIPIGALYGLFFH